MDIFGVQGDITRVRQIVYEALERFNGATVDVTIVDGKVRLTITLPPVSPPAVPNP